MKHEEEIRKILSALTPFGNLKSRESNTVEFKESFNKNSTAKYSKIMAAYANNRGGYIIFGVKDNPREVIGLKGNNFENLSQEQFTDAVNSLFAPAIDWKCDTFVIRTETPIAASGGETGTKVVEKKIGWIYAAEAEQKPIIAQKADSGEKITSGDVFYRYHARSEKIKYAEMNRIVEERAAKEREGLLKLFEVIRKSETANLGIVNYNNGDLVACFDENISEKAIREIASRQPLRAVFRDSGFTSSPEKINVFEIFKLLAPNTNVRVI